MIEESQYLRMVSLRNNQQQNQTIEIEGTTIDHLFKYGVNIIHISHDMTKLQIHLLFYYITLLQKKLPNMPLHYLQTTVFSPSHQNILLINNRQLLGGVTFCQSNRSCELSLMASFQSKKGYGTRLIHQLINLAQNRGISIIITQADNTALSFYKKMGFSQSQRNLQGVNKLNNATMMQLLVNSKIDYSKLKQIIRCQRQVLTKNLPNNEQAKSISTRPCFLRGQYFRMDPNRLDVDNFWEQYNILINSKHQTYYRSYVKPINRLIEMAVPELVELSFQPQVLSFLSYYLPIDLQSIKKKVLAGSYIAKEQLWVDLNKFIKNCRNLYRDNRRITSNIEVLARQIQDITRGS